MHRYFIIITTQKILERSMKQATQMEKNILVTTEFCIIILSKEVRCLALFCLKSF